MIHVIPWESGELGVLFEAVVSRSPAGYTPLLIRQAGSAEALIESNTQINLSSVFNRAVLQGLLRARRMGVYAHPDHDACFSKTMLENIVELRLRFMQLTGSRTSLDVSKQRTMVLTFGRSTHQEMAGGIAIAPKLLEDRSRDGLR